MRMHNRESKNLNPESCILIWKEYRLHHSSFDSWIKIRQMFPKTFRSEIFNQPVSGFCSKTSKLNRCWRKLYEHSVQYIVFVTTTFLLTIRNSIRSSKFSAIISIKSGTKETNKLFTKLLYTIIYLLQFRPQIKIIWDSNSSRGCS